MAREKKKAPAPQKGSQGTALARQTKRNRAQQYNDHIWQNLNPLKEPPKVKHKTYFESVENTDKKKKLEFKVHNNRALPRIASRGPVNSAHHLATDYHR